MSIKIQEFEKIINEAEGRLIMNVRSSLIKNAFRMESKAKLNATSFPKVVTGRLRSSIQGSVIQFGEDEFLILRAGGQEREKPRGPYSEAADVVYAAIQEFGGTSDMAGGAAFIRPKFYLKRARDEVRPRVEPDLDKAVEFALKGRDLR